jgi:flagellar hook-basal body protein
MPFTAGQIKKINSANEDKVAETVLKAMGYEGKEINEQVLGLAKLGIKERYDQVLTDTVVKLDKQLQNDILNIANENFITTTFQNAPKANKLIQLLRGVEGNISGKEYNEIRSIIGEYASGSADDNIARVLYQIQRAVDKSAERTIKPIGFTEEYTTFMSERMRKLAKEEGAEKTAALVENIKALRKQYTVYQDKQNGYPVGSLQFIDVDATGKILINFTNGQSRSIYQIGLGVFPDENSLTPLSDNVFQISSDSGEVNIYSPGENGAGLIEVKALEQANVDLSTELTRVIVTQRAFQSNTRIISVVDKMTEDLVNTLR